MIAKEKNMSISIGYLNSHQNHILVYGDMIYDQDIDMLRLESLSNTHKFNTVKFIGNGFIIPYKNKQYIKIYQNEICKLKTKILAFKDHVFIISKLVSIESDIFKKIIKPNMKNQLGGMKNVWFLW